MLTAPYVHFNNNNNNQTKQQQQRQIVTNNSHQVMTMIDYTNLYIKNLDSEVTSYDLFKRFRIFGKIISARVMKDTITGKSKGYGFVSFSHMDEANEAKKEMNGQLINSKNIVVTFHEHKKTVKKEQDLINLNSPPTTIACYPSPQSSTTLNGFIPEQQQQAKQTTYNTNPWNESGIWVQQQQQQQRVIMPQPQPQPIITTPTYSPPHSYGNNNTTMMPQLQPQPPQQQHYVAPSAAPSASFVSQQSQQQQQTNLQNQIQYQKLREAVSLQLNDQTQLDDIVDLIQSLRKRELSLCLFNPTFLKQKIDQALEALTLFHSSGSGVTTPSLVQQGQQQQSSIASSSENNDTTSQVVATILSSLEGMTLNKKKRVFGDIFFPYVRATGVKKSASVTIRLLDTVPLDELAYSMYDKKELTRKAQIAYNDLCASSSTATTSTAV